MSKIKLILLVAILAVCSFSTFAANVKMMRCNNSVGFRDIKPHILALDKSFEWQSENCKIVMTKSIFPKKNESDNVNMWCGV